MSDELQPPDFAMIDRMLQGGFHKGEHVVIMGQNKRFRWDHENKTIDCSFPPVDTQEQQEILKAYREGWTIICGT